MQTLGHLAVFAMPCLIFIGGLCKKLTYSSIDRSLSDYITLKIIVEALVVQNGELHGIDLSTTT